MTLNLWLVFKRGSVGVFGEETLETLKSECLQRQIQLSQEQLKNKDPDKRDRGDISKYEKRFPIGKPWPVNWEDIQVKDKEKDPCFSVWHSTVPQALDTKEVKRILSSYLVTPREDWADNYAHTPVGDRSGWLEFKDGTRIEYWIRMGGLAWMVYPNGGTVYLTAPCNLGVAPCSDPQKPCEDKNNLTGNVEIH